MKHIKLFENYEYDSEYPGGMRDFEEKHIGTGKIKIGFCDHAGGHGSHPCIFSKYVLENFIDEFTDFGFIATYATDNLPEALICIYGNYNETGEDRDGWFIRPISSMVASKAMKLMGTDHKDGFYENEYQKGMEILEMLGYKGSISGIETITVIPNAKLNTIYWSDNPEHSHGYWKPPYKEITMSIS